MTLNLFSLHGKTALVSGGTRGIGRSMAIALAEAGADIVLLQRNAKQSEVHEIIRALGRECVSFDCDLSSHDNVVKAVQEVLAEHRIDIVLNAAGTQYRSNAEDFPFDKYQEVLQTNLSSVFTICREVGAYWLSREQQGVIINVASLASFQGGVRIVAYAASKGGLLQLTKALSNEWAGKGIRVNAVAPGYIATDMTRDVRTNADTTLHDSISSRIPAGRWGTPDDLKGTAVFLASNASSMMTCTKPRELHLLSFPVHPPSAPLRRTSPLIVRIDARRKDAADARRQFSVLNRPPPNYPGHVPLTTTERIALAAGSAITSLINPRRGDMIAALGEATSQPFFISWLRRRMLSDSTGRRILRDRPRITSKTMSLEKLRQLPENSVGRTYARWLDREGVTPDTRDQVKYIDNEEEAYVMQRYRECHDFYHALTGLPVFVEGEVGLKAFEFANTGLPMTGLSLAAVLRLKPAERRRIFETYLPWAFSNGWRAKDVINVYWEEELETDVDELRQRVGIERPPDLRETRKKVRDEIRAQKAAREGKEVVGVEGVILENRRES